MANKSWTVPVIEDDDGYPAVELPKELLDETKWKEGDRLKWIDNDDGTWSLEKIEHREKQLVLVECIQSYRMRYVVEVPEGKKEWAEDTVAVQDDQLKEFSQLSLGETITSSRVITKEEFHKLCDEDNSYCSSWCPEKKEEVFITRIPD